MREIALSHADRSLELFSVQMVAHIMLCISILTQGNFAGNAHTKVNPRGQGWAIAGFAYMYEVTRDPKYLEITQKALDYFLERLPEDQVPPSDFSSSLEGLEFKDSSTAPLGCIGALAVA